ncbi:MAG: phenylacetate--CoA ligase family protein [Desulfobacteraceae bacterium]|nr:MAG: phenylacetate--CoA ligase family protein [Desulfobacteraceae bacterium]
MLFKKILYRGALKLERIISPDVNKALEILNKGEKASAAELQNMRNRAFVDLVSHAYKNVPYYREVMDQHGISPSSVQCLEDISRFPVLTKEDIRKSKTKLRAANIGDTDCCIRRSGGTTGEPIATYVDRLSRALETYSFFRGLQWMGWKPGLSMISLFGGSLGKSVKTSVREKIKAFILGDVFLPAFEIDEYTASHYFDVIHKSSPCVIIGYASALFNLSTYAEQKRVSDFRVKAVFSTAEVMPADWLKKISNTFGCPVLSYYGCGEVNSLGYQYKQGSPYIIPDEHVHLETIPLKNKSCDESEEILVTSLYNKAQPLIRYLNGDKGKIMAPGTNHPTRMTIDPLDGRTSDMLMREDGTFLSSSIAPHAIFITQLPVRRYQFIQWEKNLIEFRYDSEKDHIPHSSLNEIAGILKAHMGNSLTVRFHQGDDFILSPNGKHRIVIQKAGTDQ